MTKKLAGIGAALFTGLAAGVSVGFLGHTAIVHAMNSWNAGIKNKMGQQTAAAQHPSPQIESSDQNHPGTNGKPLWHCGMHPWIVQDHPGVCPICQMELTPFYNAAPVQQTQSISANGPAVLIDPAMVQNMGVQTAIVKRGTLTQTVRAAGVFKIPEPNMREIAPKVAGWIDKLYANTEGQHLNQGDPLFDLYSPDLLVAQEELLQANRTLKMAGHSAAEHAEAENLFQSARQRLTLWDVPADQIDAILHDGSIHKHLTFRSPINGHLEQRMVVQGSAIQPGMKVMEIDDHSSLWLDSQVFEDQLAGLAVGDKLTARVAAFPGRTFKAAVDFIYPHLDMNSRSVTVRATFDNANFELKPGMYATVDIAPHPIADAVLVPRQAVIDSGLQQIAFIAASPGHYEPRVVHLGASGDDDLVQVLDGLSPGQTVVTSGQFLMDVESRRLEAYQKMMAPVSAADPATAQHPEVRP